MKGNPDEIQINTITNCQQTKTERVNFTLRSPDGDGERIMVKDAYVLPDLHQSGQVLSESVDVSGGPHLRDISFPSVDVPRVSIMVGSNVPKAHVQKEIRVPEDDENSLFGYRYALGWSLCGPTGVETEQSTSLNNVSLDKNLNSKLEKFWKIEDAGTSTRWEKDSFSEEDGRAVKIIQETMNLKDGHYEVGLLWRSPRQPHSCRETIRSIEASPIKTRKQ